MATATTLLITKDDFAPYFELSIYERTAKIDPSILAAQVGSVKPILDNSTTAGESLYEELQEYIEANKTPTDADLDALLIRITPFLVYKSLLAYLPFINVVPTKVGLRIIEENNSKPADQETTAALASILGSRATTYEKELRDFLCNNATLYGWDMYKATAFNATLKIGKIGYKKRKRD